MKRSLVKCEGMDRDFKKDFRAALSQHLFDRGWGAKSKLARKIKKSPETINQILKGTSWAKEETLYAIAAYFDCTYNEFLERGFKIRSIFNNDLDDKTKPEPIEQNFITESLTMILKNLGALEQRLSKLEDNCYLIQKRISILEDDRGSPKKLSPREVKKESASSARG